MKKQFKVFREGSSNCNHDGKSFSNICDELDVATNVKANRCWLDFAKLKRQAGVVALAVCEQNLQIGSATRLRRCFSALSLKAPLLNDQMSHEIGAITL